MMRIALLLPALAMIFFAGAELHAQGSAGSPVANPPKTPNLVYVDQRGVLRWTKDRTEAAFFGVNYTLPFAYSYRAHKALGVDPEQAIRQDVYHLARLGLDAFRVHVWDTEITDSAGNLLQNDHLRLFDFLVAELKRRHIHTLITPIAFWGNGYPEKDEATPGFSGVYGKGRATSNEAAIRAQENYLQQFFRHVNPYTRLSYGDDPDVIAVELNNEPSHSGPKSGVTAYINRLAAAVRSTGWTKPLYYNISQSPYYADAVAAAAIDGVSFQWYPSGLVGGETLKGNYLPNVDKYRIPFDTIPAFRNKSRMVYEFDAADVLQSNMYPAMAKSFREAGFQWATQFAYDPMALAYANTEYQTHYVNLAYTPSKAISLLIAGAAFHRLPRLKDYGTYPADSIFDAFRVSYKEDLSEMNTEREFYYSNTTATRPRDLRTLAHLAGVGSSPVVVYRGSGAYFLDKEEEGVWRLELMPDVVQLNDPFEKASPRKEVMRVQWQSNPIRIVLPDLGQGFSIKGLNKDNVYSGTADADSFSIRPGTYRLVARAASGARDKPVTRAASDPRNASDKNALVTLNGRGVIQEEEFVAPMPFSTALALRHEPFAEVSPGRSFTIIARVAGLDTGRAFLQVSRAGGGPGGAQGGGAFRMIPMIREGVSDLRAELPAEMVMPGELAYRIILQKGKEFAVYPGDHTDDPFAWDSYTSETWKTFVAAGKGRLEIYDPGRDRGIQVYSSFRRGFRSSYITGEKPGKLILRLAPGEPSPAAGAGRNGNAGAAVARTSPDGSLADQTMGFQYSFAGKFQGRKTEWEGFRRLLIRARTEGSQGGTVKVILTDADGFSYAAEIVPGNEFKDLEVPLDKLRPDSAWIMPRPYPGFQPLWFRGMGTAHAFTLAAMEKIQVMAEGKALEVQSIWLE